MPFVTSWEDDGRNTDRRKVTWGKLGLSLCLLTVARAELSMSGETKGRAAHFLQSLFSVSDTCQNAWSFTVIGSIHGKTCCEAEYSANRFWSTFVHCCLKVLKISARVSKSLVSIPAKFTGFSSCVRDSPDEYGVSTDAWRCSVSNFARTVVMFNYSSRKAAMSDTPRAASGPSQNF